MLKDSILEKQAKEVRVPKPEDLKCQSQNISEEKPKNWTMTSSSEVYIMQNTVFEKQFHKQKLS